MTLAIGDPLYPDCSLGVMAAADDLTARAEAAMRELYEGKNQ
jgi:hypothetical protein